MSADTGEQPTGWSMGDSECQRLIEFSNTIGVGTACGPPLGWVSDQLVGWKQVSQPDGYTLFHPAGTSPGSLRIILCSHIDEPGGYVGPVSPGGLHPVKLFGLRGDDLDGCELVAMDYLDADGSTLRTCTARMSRSRGLRSALYRFIGKRLHPSFYARAGDELLLEGGELRPLRTVVTFPGEGRLEGDEIVSKALDPRAAAFAAVEAARLHEGEDVGVLLFLAEETSQCPARKAATFLSGLQSLQLLVSCDAVEKATVFPHAVEHCVLRLCEKSDLMDPCTALRLHDALTSMGPVPDLVADSRASKTHLLSRACPTISIGVPCLAIHTPRTRVKLSTIEHTVGVLAQIPGAVAGLSA